MTRRRVAVLFGGRSAEHEISCISARSVIDALDPERVEVIPIGITREGRWHLLKGPLPLPAESGRMPEVTDDAGSRVELATEGGVAPEQVLVLTGSEAAADAIRGDVEALLERGFEELAVHTVPGFCARLLHDAGAG